MKLLFQKTNPFIDCLKHPEHIYSWLFFCGTLFFKKLYMKDFKIKNNDNKSLMEEEILSGTNGDAFAKWFSKCIISW